MSHHFPIRVYYEDTDLAGIVYYANYLKFIERARSEWVREAGVDQVALKENHGTVFAVRHVSADYLAPAQFDDLLTVTTSLDKITGSRLFLTQSVARDATQLFTSQITLVCLSTSGKPTRIPADIRAKLQPHS